jgi:hypothetical protein
MILQQELRSTQEESTALPDMTLFEMGCAMAAPSKREISYA